MQQDIKQRAREIRTRLYDAGISITDAAQRIGRTRVHVSLVLMGDRESVPVLDALDALLSETPEDEHHLAALAA